jgi:prepilin-type N-terminal cleavage/methylation domain-containing protein
MAAQTGEHRPRTRGVRPPANTGIILAYTGGGNRREAMRTQINKRRVGGFTLIEVMIASSIMLLVLGSVMALASRGYKYVGDMRRSARSSQVLQQKMEDIRLLNIWNNVWALNNTSFNDTNVAGMTYNGKVTISSYNPPYPTTQVAKVTLTVTWTNSQSRVMTNRLTGLVCQNGLNKYIF